MAPSTSMPVIWCGFNEVLVFHQRKRFRHKYNWGRQVQLNLQRSLNARCWQLVVEDGKGNKPNAYHELIEAKEDFSTVVNSGPPIQPAYLVVVNCPALWVQTWRWKPLIKVGHHCFGEWHSCVEIWARIESVSRPRQAICCLCFSSCCESNWAPSTVYKEFACHCPLEMNKPDSPFYHTIKQQQKLGDDVW